MAQKEEGLFARLSPRGRAIRKKQKQVDDYVGASMSAARRVDVSYGKIPEDRVLDMVLAGDIDRIRLTLEQADHHAFQQAVDTLFYSAADFQERYSSQDTLRAQGAAYIGTGTAIVSNEGRIMVLIIKDDRIRSMTGRVDYPK